MASRPISPLVLSHFGLNIKNPTVISSQNVQLLTSYDEIAINHIYSNYTKKVPGVILNEESGMNMILQVSVFLQAVNNLQPIVIICPNTNLVAWHYHLSHEANYEIITINETNKAFIEVETSTKTAFIVDADHIQILKDLELIEFSFAIVDAIDLFANKALIKRKIYAEFHIGLTETNFYLDWNQKLIWSVLNWCHPKFAGKQKAFPQIDDLNMSTFNDNYRFCWCRLTWSYCDSFKKPTNDVVLAYQKHLKKYAQENELIKIKKIVRNVRTNKKRKSVSPSTDEEELMPILKKKTKKPINKSDNKNGNGVIKLNLSSSDEEEEPLSILRKKLPKPIIESDDENINGTFDEIDSEKTELPIVEQKDEIVSDDDGDNDILLSFLQNKPLPRLETKSHKQKDDLDDILREANDLLDSLK